MRSYCSYIAGSDMPAESWVYTINVSALLDGFVQSLNRVLETGSRDDGGSISAVAARCVLTGDVHFQGSSIADGGQPRTAAREALNDSVTIADQA